MSSSSDTVILRSDTDTHVFTWQTHQSVRIIDGPLRGVTGTVLETRRGGRVLVRIRPGVAIEVPHVLLRTVSRRK